MISIRSTKVYCKDDITKIENYEKAIADKSQVWHLHHRLETHKYKNRDRKEWIKRDENVSLEMLKAFDLYYNRPATELIFMTQSDHHSLHNKGSQYWFGKHHTEETRLKMSKAKKGKPSSRKGHKVSDETKRKMSEARKRYYELKNQKN